MMGSRKWAFRLAVVVALVVMVLAMAGWQWLTGGTKIPFVVVLLPPLVAFGLTLYLRWPKTGG